MSSFPGFSYLPFPVVPGGGGGGGGGESGRRGEQEQQQQGCIESRPTNLQLLSAVIPRCPCLLVRLMWCVLVCRMAVNNPAWASSLM